ncbi:MAG: sigma-70 family RNA polymerase sigma factor [Coriobacteriales bacterium]|jgi:RNA polymerase sigma-70 factor (ECF subfamily)|nr:sigma-70 family RNA polymerase sigma factor [Coriobacteriales bacterium]
MGFRDQRTVLKALRRQDLRALDAAIEQYGGYVMAVALHTLGSGGSRQDAEEITADVFIALWRNAAKLASGSNLKPWLAVVARNTSLKRLRSLSPTLSLEEHGALAAVANENEESPEYAKTADGPEESAMEQALDGLSATDRDLLCRHYCDEQSIDAIAEETGLSQPAVKSRLYRSRKALRSRLAWRGTPKENRG